jgi:hypothetical protein
VRRDNYQRGRSSAERGRKEATPLADRAHCRSSAPTPQRGDQLGTAPFAPTKRVVRRGRTARHLFRHWSCRLVTMSKWLPEKPRAMKRQQLGNDKPKIILRQFFKLAKGDVKGLYMYSGFRRSNCGDCRGASTSNVESMILKGRHIFLITCISTTSNYNVHSPRKNIRLQRRNSGFMLLDREQIIPPGSHFYQRE